MFLSYVIINRLTCKFMLQALGSRLSSSESEVRQCCDRASGRCGAKIQPPTPLVAKYDLHVQFESCLQFAYARYSDYITFIVRPPEVHYLL